MDKALRYLAGFGLLYIALALFCLPGYIGVTSLNMQLGTVALFLTARADRSRTGSWRYGIGALICLLLLYSVPAKTFIYLSIVMALAFAVESYAGRLNLLPLLVLVFMSPIFGSLSDLFSFPVRLFITKLAGTILDTLGQKVLTEGNVILLDGVEFAVDPACIGLHMFSASLLAGCMLIAIWQKRFLLLMPAGLIVASLLCIGCLNVLSNVARILVLVQFNIPPGNVLHEITGLVCFLVYQLLPAAWLIRWLVKRFGKQAERLDKQAPTADKQAEHTGKQIADTGIRQDDHTLLRRPQTYRLWPNVLLLLLTVAVAVTTDRHLEKDTRVTTPGMLAGYKSETVPGNVVKLYNDQVLIYIKPLAGFYSMEHHPMICWKGSGYVFKKVVEKDDIYIGILEKGGERLYTAWWYDNGHLSTISQLEWRMTAMSGRKGFSLINITAGSPEALQQQIACFRRSNVLLQLQP